MKLIYKCDFNDYYKWLQTDECINGLMSTKEKQSNTNVLLLFWSNTHTQVVIKKHVMHQYFNTEVWNSL